MPLAGARGRLPGAAGSHRTGPDGRIGSAHGGSAADIYDGSDPRDVPVYSIPEAAHYLRLPPSTLRSWVIGRDYQVQDGTRGFEPVIHLPDPDVRALSFTNLVEAHVLRGARRDHGVALHKVRSAVDYVRRRMDIDRPLAHVQFETDGVDLFATDYRCDRLMIEEAIRCEHRHAA